MVEENGKTSEKLNEATKLLGVILYSDKTHLTHKNTQHAHPVNLSLGNFTQNQRSKKEGRRLLCYLPIIKKSSLNPALKAKLSREIFHTCMKILLSPLKEHKKIKDADGKEHLVVSKISYYIGDWLEKVF